MILALPIDGRPICFSTNSEGWRANMEAMIGASPELNADPKKNRTPAGATFKWIRLNFSHCPDDANEDLIQRYARVYVWYVISRSLFADGSGRTAPWMWLKALSSFESNLSWGSAALAYLYRQVIHYTLLSIYHLSNKFLIVMCLSIFVAGRCVSQGWRPVLHRWPAAPTFCLDVGALLGWTAEKDGVSALG